MTTTNDQTWTQERGWQIEHPGPYGTRVVGPFRRLDLGGWYREDEFVDRTGYGTPDGLHAAGPNDHSAGQSSRGNGYDASCGWCYLGTGHTVEAHDQKIEG